MPGAVVDCDKCAEIYDPEEPPCDECGKPELLESNQTAWELWALLNFYDRPASQFSGFVLPIPTQAVIRLCEAYGESLTTFEKILVIEDKVLPNLRKAAKAAANKEKIDEKSRSRRGLEKCRSK